MAVRVNLTANALKVIHCLVNEVLLFEAAVSARLVSVDGGLLSDAPEDFILRGFAPDVRDHSRPNLPSGAVKHPHYNRLIRVPGGPAAESRALWAHTKVHILDPAAHKGFVHFCRATFAAHLVERFVPYGLTDAMEHEPRGFLSDPNGPVEFVAADAVLAVADHPHCRHPPIQTNRGILKDRADLEGELLLAAVAEPNPTGLHKRIAFRTATRTKRLPIRPAQELRIIKCAFRVGEVSDCLLKSYGLFHLSHVLSDTRVPQSDLCVKYVIAGILLPAWLLPAWMGNTGSLSMPAGYSGAPLASKLGVKAGQRTWRLGMQPSVAAEIAEAGASPILLPAPAPGLEMAHI